MVKTNLYTILIITLNFTTFAVPLDWWEDASLYQIYPRSWKDSDGNGIGDLKGITENLGYIKKIGMTATWLSPIFKSPMADNGYDITNFTEIDPIFGTMDDFDALIKKSKEIGIKIILDFVPNHSSDECEWFQKSVNREDGYDDFYVWADGLDDPKNPLGQKLPPSNWVSLLGGPMWKWNKKRHQFYLHHFLNQQPDFNFRNEIVHEKMFEIMKFWLDRGVDGFRIDAASLMYEKVFENGTYPDEDRNTVTYTQNQYETVQLLYDWRKFLDIYQKENGGDTRFLLAEAYSPISWLDKIIGNRTKKGVHSAFNFALLELNKTANARNVENLVDSWMNVMWKKHQIANWVTSNHDRDRITEKVGQNKTDLMYFLVTGLPGITITYYGEEIGMSNGDICTNCSKHLKRNNERTPFQWNNSTSAGFSLSNNTWLPVNNNYKNVNVQNQLASEKSPLRIFIALQKLKETRAFKSFKDKNGFSYNSVNDNVFQIIRRSSDEEYRFLINFGDNEEDIGSFLSLEENSQNNLMEYRVVSRNSPHAIGDTVKLTDIILMPFEGIALRRVYKD
ncbi:maltase A2-like [Episyrphus balteatus]|uniref:maltase A2-like n=1 Tax=Episyrphus balteatus TaxID=286459 RepID=UPI002486BCE2|nr:maltase A2-like [Episyrphus balteatus]